MSEGLIAFEGEVMLIGWDESHNTGRTARFLFDEDGPEHPMKPFTVRRGKTAGTRFFIRMIELNDADEPVDQKKRAAVEKAMEGEKPKGGAISKNAGMLVRDKDFQRFAAEALGKETAVEHAADIDTADEYLKRWCGIRSKAELDHNRDAEIRYRHLRGAYLRWSEG